MTAAILDRGIVKKVVGEVAFVEVMDIKSCEHCGARVICAPDSRDTKGLYARNNLGAAVGDEVVITDVHQLLLRLSFMQFGLPLLGFLLGIFAAYGAGVSIPNVADEIVLFISGLVGLALGGFISWKWAVRASKRQHMFFEISKINKGD